MNLSTRSAVGAIALSVAVLGCGPLHQVHVDLQGWLTELVYGFPPTDVELTDLVGKPVLVTFLPDANSRIAKYSMVIGVLEEVRPDVIILKTADGQSGAMLPVEHWQSLIDWGRVEIACAEARTVRVHRSGIAIVARHTPAGSEAPIPSP